MSHGKNPVLFDGIHPSEKLTIYSATLHEFGWKNRLVGIIKSGFLYVDEKNPRSGYYEYRPKVLEWSRIQEVRIGRMISVKGILLGICGLALGFFAFMAGWVNKTHTGIGIITLPILGVLGGGVLILGAVRNRIIVVTEKRKYQWISEPLQYKKTLPICVEATRAARTHRIFLTSHVE